MDEWVAEFKQRIEAEENRQNHRIDSLEQKVDRLIETNTAIQLVEQKIDILSEKVAKIDQNVEKLEAEPGDNWKKAVWIVITVVITAVVTYFIKG